MVSMRTSPAEPVGAQRGQAPPSPAATALLVLLWLVLWLGVAWACALLLLQRGIAREFNVALSDLAIWLLRLPWWDWFGSYGGWTVLGLIVLTPVVGLLTYWIRHRLRSRLAGWAWGVLLIVPTFLLLAAAALGLGALGAGIKHELQTLDPANYLTDDGQQLRSALKLREISNGAQGPDGETVVIEPGGNWRVVPGANEGGRPPLRRGKLTREQMAILAGQLARLQFLQCSEPENESPPPAPPALVIEFGGRSLSLEGVSRQGLLQSPALQEWQAGEPEFRARFAPLVLVIEELVKPDRPD